MPNTKSAKKRLRQNRKRRLHNRSKKAAAKTYIRRVQTAVAEGDVERAEAELRIAYKAIDKCAKRRIFHPNKAARLKANIAKEVERLRRILQTTAEKAE